MDNCQLPTVNSQLKKGYKQTEVGVIPEDWEVKNLGEVAKAEGGYAFSSKKFLNSGKFQVVKMSNLYGGHLDLERSQSFLDELNSNEHYFQLKQNDILITLTGTVGKTDYGYSYRINEEKNLLLNQRVARIICDTTTNPAYLGYEFKTNRFLKQFFEKAKGGTGNQANIGTNDIEEISIPLPPTKAEQTAIATVLSDADALISGLEKLIAKKRHIKKGAMQELLTGKKRLPGFRGKWEVKKLGEIADIEKGEQLNRETLTESGAYPVYNGGISPSGYTNKWNTEIETIIISEGGNSCGYVNYIKERFWRGGHCYKVKPNIEKEFLFHLLKSLEKNIMNLRVGSGLPNIQRGRLLSFELSITKDKATQTHIAQILSDMDAEIEALEKKLEKYKMIKQGMMQELLTGKTRLV